MAVGGHVADGDGVGKGEAGAPGAGLGEGDGGAAVVLQASAAARAPPHTSTSAHAPLRAAAVAHLRPLPTLIRATEETSTRRLIVRNPLCALGQLTQPLRVHR